MLKKCLAIAAIFFVLAFVFNVNDTSANLRYTCGDADGNLTINLLDVTYILTYIYLGGPAPDPVMAADVDLNSQVNLLDITYLINYLYREGPAPCYTVPSGQEYFFDVWYVNGAWGDYYYGFCINNEGFVYWYDRQGAWFNPANPDSITSEEMAGKYGPIHNGIAFVDMDTLNAMYSLIDQATQGPIGPPETVCFDWGAYCFYAYQYDSESGNYIPVMIFIGGDVEQENLSPVAEVLFTWLKSITENFSNPYCGF